MLDLLTLDELFAQNYVKRYHMVRISRDQSVLEHSAKVAYIASKLLSGYVEYLESRNPTPSILIFLNTLKLPETKLAVLELALSHDSPETVCSDIASNVGKFMGKDLKHKIEQELFWKERTPTKYPMIVQHLVKFADYLEGYLFFKWNGGTGANDLHDPRKAWVLNNWTEYIDSFIETISTGEGSIDKNYLLTVWRETKSNNLGISISNL
jgi:5'-deoxynucleotidase YfbR-like HD superfamily hydrolase